MAQHLELLPGFAKGFGGRLSGHILGGLPRGFLEPRAGYGRPATYKDIGRFRMAAGADRILVTHVGSLVRPPELIEFLKLVEAGQPYDKAGYEACLKASIEEIVRQQVEA